MNRTGATPLSIVFAAVATTCVVIVLYALFDSSRGKKRMVACQSNLKQISIAISQYAQDYDDTLPRAWYGKDAGPSNAVTYKWMDAIYPYVKNAARFQCPSDHVNTQYVPQTGTNYGSYVYNNAYYAPGDKFTPPSGLTMSMIPDGMTVLVMDGENDFQFAWPDAKHALEQSDADPSHIGSIVLRHDRYEPPSPCTLCVNGFVTGYSFRQIAAERVIRGQKIYTGFTIERD